MANVTYYLGAGASANALPTYENFGTRFNSFAERFTSNFVYEKADDRENYLKNEINRLCSNFLEELKHHNTPDTLAKRLFHQDPKELIKLKHLLILFFLEQQLTGVQRSYDRDVIDKRYDSLLASIIKPIQGKIEFTGNFNILTWNYDLQFELALARYVRKTVREVSKMFNMHPALDNGAKSDYSKISCIHLNGVAYCEGERFENPFSETYINYEVFQILIDLYQELKKMRLADFNYSNLLEFAWEKYNDDFSAKETDVLAAAKKVAAETEILVIIGYSFPIFNSSIDSALFKQMKKLKKVYLQTNDTQLINQLMNSDLHEIFKVKNAIVDLGYTKQFHIPVEWNRDVSKDFDFVFI